MRGNPVVMVPRALAHRAAQCIPGWCIGNALENCVGTLLPVSSILLIKRYYLLVFFFQERTIKDNDKKKGRNRCIPGWCIEPSG
jgi:hypothetical protein